MSHKNRNTLLGFGLALFLNFEGILAKVFNIPIEAGFLNQLYAPLFLIIVGSSAVFFYYFRVEEGKKSVSILFLSTFFLSVLILLTSLNFFDINKVLRDLIYLWLIYLIYQVYYWKDIGKRYLDNNFVKGLVYSFLILFPLSNWLYTFGAVERFSGWVLSKPHFANMVLVVACLNLIFIQKIVLKHAIAILSIVFLIASGTRTTMLAFLLFYLHYFLKRQSMKRIVVFLGIALSIGVSIIIYFFSEIKVLFELASQYRAFTIDDGGSIMSRLAWYRKVAQSLLEHNIFGGFGAGASERLLGILTHFDFLRFWYDYTLFFPIVFIGNLSFIYFKNRTYKSNYYKLIDGSLFFFIILVFMAHNVFQSFTMVIMVMLYMLISNKKNLQNEFGGCFYRISVASDTSSGNTL